MRVEIFEEVVAMRDKDNDVVVLQSTRVVTMTRDDQLRCPECGVDVEQLIECPDCAGCVVCCRCNPGEG